MILAVGPGATVAAVRDIDDVEGAAEVLAFPGRTGAAALQVLLVGLVQATVAIVVVPTMTKVTFILLAGSVFEGRLALGGSAGILGVDLDGTHHAEHRDGDKNEKSSDSMHLVDDASLVKKGCWGDLSCCYA